MANLVQGEWAGMPQNDVFEIETARRKRRMAEALRTQAQPNGQMVGNVYVAPSITQRLATLLQNWQGGQQERAADAREREIYTNRQNTVTEAGNKLAEALKPRQVQDGETVTTAPFNPEQMDQFGSPLQGVQREQTRTPTYKTVNPGIEDMLRAQLEYSQAIGDPNAMSNALGTQIQYQGQQQARNDEREWRSQEAQLNREQRAQELMFRMQDARATQQERLQAQKELAQMQIEARRDIANIAAANRPAPTPVSVMGDDGKPIFVSPAEAVGKRPYGAAQEAKDAAKAQAQSSAALSAQQVLDQAKILYDHPGRETATGASSFLSKIPGTDAKGFQANLDTFKAQTFVPMVSALKGMGALSDAEGKKLSDSVGALNPDMKEDEFRESLKLVTKTLYDKARASGLNVSMPDFPSEKGKSKVQDEADRILNGNR
jgi:hypothetical protein